MDIQKIYGLIEIYSNLPHAPHNANQGTNTGCNDLAMDVGLHKELSRIALDNIPSHDIETRRLSKSSIATHVPRGTDPKMVRRLELLGAYVTQIDISLDGDRFSFQGISTSKRDSISMAYIVSLGCLKKLGFQLSGIGLNVEA